MNEKVQLNGNRKNVAHCNNCMVGKSVRRCVLIEAEASIRANTLYSEEFIQNTLHRLEVAFECMDKLGISKVNWYALMSFVLMSCIDERVDKLLNLDHKFLVDFFYMVFDSIEKITPECIERGKPELPIACDESCRHKMKFQPMRTGVRDIPYIQECQNECPLLNYLGVTRLN